jgi:catechol 2,3-dioxygenase-like lactoylglutathione lyase family enzyme
MRVVADEHVVEFVGERGGQVFVWPLALDAPTGGATVFSLEASTESPGAEHEFVRFAGQGFDLLIDTAEHGVPDELHLAVRGWRQKRIRAYWNGKSFGRD